jgi:Fe-S oxidoreductase
LFRAVSSCCGAAAVAHGNEPNTMQIAKAQMQFVKEDILVLRIQTPIIASS